jgi:hypothetical protein
MTQGNLFFNKKKKIFSVQSPGVNRVWIVNMMSIEASTICLQDNLFGSYYLPLYLL